MKRVEHQRETTLRQRVDELVTYEGTHDIFGDFIDRYTIKQSEDDGATVPILYEGRYAKGAVADAAGLDDELAAMFPEMTSDEREALKRKYGSLNAILEAEEVVGEKASDMLRHYVENVLPNGLKAQVVAITRRAAVRYQAAFVAARNELVAEAEKLDAEHIVSLGFLLVVPRTADPRRRLRRRLRARVARTLRRRSLPPSAPRSGPRPAPARPSRRSPRQQAPAPPASRPRAPQLRWRRHPRLRRRGAARLSRERAWR